MSNIDSRLVERHGFKDDVVSPQGMSLGNKEQNDLSESVDSHQAALDLAATMPHVEFDLFLTFTCNQQLHYGVDWFYSRVLANESEGKGGDLEIV